MLMQYSITNSQAQNKNLIFPYNFRARRVFLTNVGKRPIDNGQSKKQGRKSSYVKKEKENINNEIIMNEKIIFPMVRLLNEKKEMIGIYSIEEAKDLATEEDVDLVLISTTSDYPLCRLISSSKYKYEMEKEKKLLKQKQRASRIQVKELTLRPTTDIHDYQVRLRKTKNEISKGNIVKLVVQFRGRELQFTDKGKDILHQFMQDTKDYAIVEENVRMFGNNMTLTLGPIKS